MPDQAIQIIQQLSWPGAFAIAIWKLAPFVPVLLSKIPTKNGENTEGSTFSSQMDELMQFKETAETNHYTDLDRLIQRDKEHDQMHERIWFKINSMSEDVSYIKGRLNGKTNH